MRQSIAKNADLCILHIMVRKVTATELARNVGEILGRIRYQGDSYVIERNGEVVARIIPEEEPEPATVRDLVELWEGFDPDPELADLLEGVDDFEYPPDDVWAS